MRPAVRIIVIFLIFAHSAAAIPTGIGPSGGDLCRAAITAAERGHGIAPHLLAAIARVESGRKDPVTGAWAPWPWTINAEGAGSFFDSKAQAIAAVGALRAKGVKSIDVGCLQVNLMHHPDAFASLDQAFEPATNADYAARFLAELHEQTNDWTAAAARYHSANPAEGTAYAAKVAAVWQDAQRTASAAAVPFTATKPGLFASPPPRPAPAGTGRGLSFYRAAPVMGLTRARAAIRVPYLAALR